VKKVQNSVAMISVDLPIMPKVGKTSCFSKDVGPPDFEKVMVSVMSGNQENDIQNTEVSGHVKNVPKKGKSLTDTAQAKTQNTTDETSDELISMEAENATTKVETDVLQFLSQVTGIAVADLKILLTNMKESDDNNNFQLNTDVQGTDIRPTYSGNEVEFYRLDDSLQEVIRSLIQGSDSGSVFNSPNSQAESHLQLTDDEVFMEKVHQLIHFLNQKNFEWNGPTADEAFNQQKTIQSMSQHIQNSYYNHLESATKQVYSDDDSMLKTLNIQAFSVPNNSKDGVQLTNNTNRNELSEMIKKQPDVSVPLESDLSAETEETGLSETEIFFQTVDVADDSADDSDGMQMSLDNKTNVEDEFIDKNADNMDFAVNFNNVFGDVTENVAVEHSGRSANAHIALRENIFKQVVDHAKVLISEDRSEMILQLKPENLGKLSLQVVTERGLMVAKFTAESIQVKEIIEANLPQLKTSLESQGIHVQGFSVSVGDHSSQRRTYPNPRVRWTGKRILRPDTEGISVLSEQMDRRHVLDLYHLSESTVDFTA